MWVLKYDSGQFYFGNVKTRKSQWYIPADTILAHCTESGWKMLMIDGDIVYTNPDKDLTRKTIPVSKPFDLWSIHYEDGWCWFYNEKTNVSQWEIPSAQTTRISKEKWKMRYVAGHVYFYNQNVISCDVPRFDKVSCGIVRGLNWVGNSCYVDSVLVALFAVPTTFTDKIIYDKDVHSNNTKHVQKQLRKIVESMRGKRVVNTCSDLRLTFKQFKNQENYWDTNTKDAGEFLVYLLSLFPETNTAMLVETGYYTNDLSSSNPLDKVKSNMILDKRASTVWSIDSIYLSEQPTDTKLSELSRMKFISIFDEKNMYRNMETGKTYRKKTSIRTLVDAPYIIFNVMRKNVITNKLITTPIIPDVNITLPSGTNFVFSAVVVYVSGHYVCYFSCENIWYFYDDLGGMYNIKKIGVYSDLLNAIPSVKASGVLYFYTPSKNYQHGV